MPSTELTMKQIRDMGIPEQIKDREQLSGLAEIACFMECSISRVRHLIKNQGLPAASSGGRGSSYFTTKKMILDWVREQHLRNIVRHEWDTKHMHNGKMHGKPLK